MDIPLHLIKGEDAIRLIMAWPIGDGPLEHSPIRDTRKIRVRHTRRYKPSNQDLRTWVKADHGHYWKAWKEDEYKEFPRVGVMIGPLLKSGSFFSPEYIMHPLAFERERSPFKGLYGRNQHDAEVAGYEYRRGVIRDTFIKGQTGEGPYFDGVVFMRADQLLLAEIESCHQRLRATSAILRERKIMLLAKGEMPAKENWMRIGAEEKVAIGFKHRGCEVRKVDCAKPYYEVKI